MARQLQHWFTQWMIVGMLLLLITMGWTVLESPPASARVIQEQLPDSFILDKSLRTVKDARGYSWQAIAFKNTQNGNSDGLFLRLVGFPGAIAIDRARPMIVATSSGQTMMLKDVSSLIFKNGLLPQPNVAQYQLEDVINQLQSATPLRLTIPAIPTTRTVSGGSLDEASHPTEQLELSIPRAVVKEWIAVSNQP
ncbi:MAG: DUF3122 domain-containing protein [Cyanobacteria bacterium P01_A01_bin.37]